MRVLPWNQSERVQENIGRLPLASPKKESRGCASFICSWCASTGPDGSSPSSVKVEAVHPSNCQGDGSSMARPASLAIPAITTGEAANGDMKVSLKSNLKKPCGSSGTENTRSPNRANAAVEQGISNLNCNRKRKVQWTDAHGKELAQVKEFELSSRSMLSPVCRVTALKQNGSVAGLSSRSSPVQFP